MDSYELKFKRPLTVMTVGLSHSGKSKRHLNYFKYPHKYFTFSKPDNANISELLIVSDEASLHFWENLETPISYRLFNYDSILEVTELKSNSVVLVDDLIPANYKKIKNWLNKLIDVWLHHYMSNLFCISQTILNCEISQLLLKICELHLCGTNSSSIKTMKYICQYYFYGEDKKLLMKGLNDCKNLEDSYICVKLKDNYGIPILIDLMQ